MGDSITIANIEFCGRVDFKRNCSSSTTIIRFLKKLKFQEIEAKDEKAMEATKALQNQDKQYTQGNRGSNISSPFQTSSQEQIFPITHHKINTLQENDRGLKNCISMGIKSFPD